MRKLILIKFILLSLLLLVFNPFAYCEQTIVFIRHGEKPDNNSGQLTCKGLNRALALPDVLINRFGVPDALFAAAPKQNKLGNSLRSLETISPTAIISSLPIHLNYHAKDIDGLQKALLDAQYNNALIIVAWEHDNLVKVVKNIMTSLGEDPQLVPKWQKGDFDSMYVLRINHAVKPAMIHFEQYQEGLNSVSDKCIRP